MKNNLTIKLFIAAVFILPVSVYAMITWYQHKFRQLPVFGKEEIVEGKKIQHTIAPFILTDQDGNISSEEKWKNKIVIADFFFTRCPSVCPKMTHNLLRVQ